MGVVERMAVTRALRNWSRDWGDDTDNLIG